MDINDPVKRSLVYAVAVALGVGILGPLGPLLFSGLDRSVPAGTVIGCFVGAAIGFAIARTLFTTEMHRQNRMLQQSAEAVRSYSGLPSSIHIQARDGCLILLGTVDDVDTRRHAEQTLLLVPGVRDVKNELRVDPAKIASVDEIAQQIREGMEQVTKQEGEGIRVFLETPARIVLEGTVHSTFESSQAEEIAWNLPGVAEVDNRLEVEVYG